jgi:hypothetical protein
VSNVILNPGAGGATLGTDTVGGVDYQKVKPAFSTDGTTPVSVDATHGLPVTPTSAAGTAFSVGTGNTDAGTQRVVIATDQPSFANAVPVLQSGTWSVAVKTAATGNAPAAVSVGVVSTPVLAANSNRKGCALVNTSANIISLAFDGAAAVLNSGATLVPYGSFSMDPNDFSTGAINAIASAAASNLAVQEWQ